MQVTGSRRAGGDAGPGGSPESFRGCCGQECPRSGTGSQPASQFEDSSTKRVEVKDVHQKVKDWHTADETGFILIPETAIRGYQGQRWDEQNFTRAVKELAETCRNHPSVCFYSLQNEENPAWVGSLVDAMVTADNTRPLVFEDSEQNRPGPLFGRSGAHAYAMLHYRPAPTNSAFMIVGMGECAWNAHHLSLSSSVTGPNKPESVEPRYCVGTDV